MAQKENYIFKMLKKVKSFLLRKMRLQLKRFNYTYRIRVNETSINITSINGMNCSITEPWMIELLKKLLKKTEGAFIDVGINLGQTLVKLKSIDLEKQNIGFEPNPACVYYINELIKLNNFQNCSIFPVALHIQDQVLPLEFFSDDVADSCASLIKNYRPSQRVVNKIYVPVFSFKSISKLLNFDSIAIIKIDVEGAELEVIKSLLELIKINRPVILLEILPVYNYENIFRLDRQKKIEKIFQSIGYSFYRVNKKGNKFSSLVKINVVDVHSDIEQCDYVVAPEEFIL